MRRRLRELDTTVGESTEMVIMVCYSIVVTKRLHYLLKNHEYE